MSAVRYIFNTHGTYVAYVENNNIFTADNRWYGFLNQGNLVYQKTGKFVGYLRDDDRIVKKKNEPPRPRLYPPVEPLPLSRPVRPSRQSPMTRLPPPYEDVFEKAT